MRYWEKFGILDGVHLCQTDDSEFLSTTWKPQIQAVI